MNLYESIKGNLKDQSYGEVYTVCYNAVDIWKSKKAAMDFYEEAIYACDGSERDRYVNVYMDLKDGKTFAYDGDGNTVREIHIRDDKGDIVERVKVDGLKNAAEAIFDYKNGNKLKESDKKKKKYSVDDFDTLEDALKELKKVKGVDNYFTKEEWDEIDPDDINTCNYYIKDIVDNYLNESEEDGGYEEIDSKYVEDSSGFTTQYTMYKAPNGKYVFVFGDKDLYRPEDGDYDWEEDDEEAAKEWFRNYKGFADIDEAEEPEVRKTKIVSLSNQLKRVCDEIENIAEMYDETAGDEEDVFAGTEDEYALEMLDQHLGEIFLNDPVLSRLDDGKMTDIISEIMNYIVNGYSVDFRLFLGILKKYKAFEGVLERMEV